ncbi:2-amino-4-hydroxy-6-hydroxymethyldihydropteridine diphosphokinase [Teredinibacter purpureus]|uniref:2-amino-4-hydroxy-6- hydroxymethyldihydropteridine diphosphokinase n=1 Tax=Teredinibacter purpureus TaxID=2731756 RepID=UPI0005F895E0|nr:2-amino-4-hydroxy-6-hydroxymethyldihydropteridine diphosphokinase [Teredinibacter purpureus]
MHVFISLGSNLASPLQQVTQACETLQKHPNITLTRCSPWYKSRAVGPPQPDYINGVAALDCTLSPEALLDALQSIERQQQRKRGVHWGPRTLDLDILLYGNSVINTDRLTVPHPWMTERNFVLQPLLDIAPQLTLPNGLTITSLLAAIGHDGLTLLSHDN